MTATRRMLFQAGLGLFSHLGPAALWASPALAQPDSQTLAQPSIVLDSKRHSSDRLSTQVRINDQGPFDFVVDTGSNRTVLSDDLADRLSLNPGPDVVVHGLTAAEPARTVLIDQFSMGAFSVRTLVVPVFPRARVGAAGLIGLDALSNTYLLMDHKRRKIEITPVNARTRRVRATEGRLGTRLLDRVVLSGQQKFGQLVSFRIRIGQMPVMAFLDTGSERTIGNSALYQRINSKRYIYDELQYTTDIFGVTGQTISGTVTALRELNFDKYSIFNAPIVFADVYSFSLWGHANVPALILGYDIVSLFSEIGIDFKSSRVEISSPLDTVLRS